jgi:hypothetical protein
MNHRLSTVAKRLRYIRALLRLTRKYIEEKYHIPEITLKSWEGGNVKLTDSALNRCMEMYRAEGVIVSKEWILHGVGLDPMMTETVKDYLSHATPLPEGTENDELDMFSDAEYFKKKYKNAVVLMVPNNDMAPVYQTGDYVGGKMRQGKALESALNKDCIIQLKNGELHFRRLTQDSKGLYNLSILNFQHTQNPPVIFHAEVESAAPIIWHRRKDI